MKLIADSGSTKTDWSLVGENGEVVATCNTLGLNPYHLQDEDILRVLREDLQLPSSPSEVYFYGSGVTEAMKPRVKGLLGQVFEEAEIEAEGDLLGAARAIFGREKGIACILGTGSNSCLYDGERIVMNTPPMGYILGDEGSGTDLGKRFLNAAFKGLIPVSLKEKYMAWAGLTYADIINKVYREPLANRFLASVVPFISQELKANKDTSGEERRALEGIVLSSLDSFRQNALTPYLENLPQSECPIGFVGSIAYFFRDYVSKCCDKAGLRLVRVLKSPMEGLMEFHGI